ncbi:hypothetical protein Peur_029635 [Populus x canadensis]
MHVDVELNEVGREQAAVVADRLTTEFKVSAACSSDLKRAFETAEKIAATCGIVEGGGESLGKLYECCTSSLERIAAKHTGERVAVVTHGGVIRELYQRACPHGKSGGRVLNTSINIFHIS